MVKFYRTLLTNWNHAFVVIVEVLSDNLNQGGNRAPVSRLVAAFFTQKLVLDLHLSESARQPSDNGFIWNFVNLNTDDYTKVEHKLISLVLLVIDTNRVTKDPVSVVRITDGDISVAKCLPGNDILCNRLKVK